MKIRIGSTKYDLQTTKNAYSTELGLCDMDENIIIVNNGHDSQTIKQTLWHEVMHAMLKEMVENDLCNDEVFVDRMAKFLYAFHEDNKLDKIYEKLK